MSDFVDYDAVKQQLLDEKQASNLTAAELLVLPRRIQRAYEKAVKWVEWPFLHVGTTVACASGLVLPTALTGPFYWEFWESDPRVPNSTAVRIEEQSKRDVAGWHLNTTKTSVFALSVPNLTALGDWANDSRYVTPGPTDWASEPTYLGSWSTLLAADAIAIGDIVLFQDGYCRAITAGTWDDMSKLVDFYTNWENLLRYVANKIYLVDSVYYLCLLSTGAAPPSDNFTALGAYLPIHRNLVQATVYLTLAEWCTGPQQLADAQTFRDLAALELGEPDVRRAGAVLGHEYRPVRKAARPCGRELERQPPARLDLGDAPVFELTLQFELSHATGFHVFGW